MPTAHPKLLLLNSPQKYTTLLTLYVTVYVSCVWQREQNLLDNCFNLLADFEEENYHYLAETARRDSWVEAESVERCCSASRWAVESSNTLLWKVILSKKTQSQDRKSRRNTSWTTTYKISCQSKLNTFSVRLPIPFSREASLRTVLWWFQAWESSWHNIVNDILLTENIPHLESTVANWHLDPGTQLWAGTSPQSSQSPHWVEKVVVV